MNCAAIPADLLESEIFGHEKGAFTGAQQRHLGYAERAGKGTLFLDEIGDMPPPLQAKLLGLIEDGSFIRVGGETPVPFRARIVAATHRDLATRRPDQFPRRPLFSARGLPVEIPPLRQRQEDIAWLLDRFLENAVSRSDTRIRGFSALAEEAALAHPWPGNVRELRNRVERAVALRPAMDHAGRPFSGTCGKAGGAGFRAAGGRARRCGAAPDRAALEETGGQIAKAAGLLGISRTTLWEKMTRFGLARPGAFGFPEPSAAQHVRLSEHAYGPPASHEIISRQFNQPLGAYWHERCIASLAMSSRQVGGTHGTMQ